MRTFTELNEAACNLVTDLLNLIRERMTELGLRAVRLDDDTSCIIVYDYDHSDYVGMHDERVLGFYLEEDGSLLMRTTPYSDTMDVTNDVVTGPELPGYDILDECMSTDNDFINLLTFLDLSDTLQETFDKLSKNH